MDAAEIIGVIIGGSTIILLLLVMLLFQTVYIILPRKDFNEKYTLKDAPVGLEEVEEEAALV